MASGTGRSTRGGRRGGSDGPTPEIDIARFGAMRWRCIGPFRGGRVVAVAGDPVEQQTFYFGSTGGGVWKSTDGGMYWQNISDGFFQRASVGAIAVADADPNVIYVGLGESTIRGNASHGDGVYKSLDAGKTWQHCSLADTRHIAKVRVHPRDPDTVWVAALGHAHGPNAERGVFRSRDGGRSWERVLFVSEDAGAIDLTLNPHNPRTLVAACWQARRLPHRLDSGGPGSGLWRSTDGGDTWTDLAGRPGLPPGKEPGGGGWGKIGVALSPANPERIWALIEAPERPGLYRSDDGGDTWQLINAESELRQRPWYYMHIYADPLNADTVWVLNLKCLKSVDGGRSFAEVPTWHGDNHDLWFDARNPRRMMNGNDGGASVSFNGGASLSTVYNQPTAEFYHVTTDHQMPYRVYGSQQDNSAISLPAYSNDGGITQLEWEVPGGGESGYIAVKPDDPNLIYGGSYSGMFTRYDRRSRQAQDVTVWPEQNAGWPAKDLKYRFQWTFPLHFSPHDPNTLYAAGNHVFRTRDEGASWEAISPDLTRADPATLESSGGPITQDNISTEYYATVFAFAESPVQAGVMWAGSDDGLVHVSRDGGANWQNVTPPELPEWSLISLIEASPHDAGTAYLAANRYKLDDFTPYLFKTSDFGGSWTRIGVPSGSGIPADSFARAIRADPVRRGLLYAGTETGVWVSHSDGAHWQRLNLNLPVVPIHDLHITHDDLIVATHGRSFWVLDDLTPLRGATPETVSAPAHLFPPRPAYRWKLGRGFGDRHAERGRKYLQHAGPVRLTFLQTTDRDGEPEQLYLDAGKNPPIGAIIDYYLAESPEAEITLTILDRDGNEIRSFTSAAPPAAPTEGHGAAKAPPAPPRLTKRAGLNRFVWDLHHADATFVPGAVFWGGNTEGPAVSPGTYQVRLTTPAGAQTHSFEVRQDPRVPVSQADLDAQYALLRRIHDALSAAHAAVNEIRSVREQVGEWQHRAAGSFAAGRIDRAGQELTIKIAAIEDALIQGQAAAFEDTLNFPIRLNNKFASLADTVAQADARPTTQSYAVYDALKAQLDEQLARLGALFESDVPAFSQLVANAGLAGLVMPAESR